ncbi:ferric iron uptake transcriptional regulator [Rubrivivax gelatinosus]|uniref:Ferric uptake regulation protein n=1 Tax=Rubrivivax gelatinosus TaxID=28068 RepID=A0ABS1E006_RUBGE|nr:ferric iron uptake transcriptional regulator [Rubrivivax gelatinosus]MBK1715659.1 ferric iron uptake transcriptional regulator [Rubrivivax gelatinosus]
MDDLERSLREPELAARGLRLTQPRMRIIEIFRESPLRHLSAEDVHRRILELGLDIGLPTVYRVLGQFEQAQILVRSQLEGTRAIYELNQGEHHDHMVCVRCGRVEEFSDAQIERRQELVARQRGFELTHHRLALFGLCADCTTAERDDEPRAPDAH